MNLAGIIVVNGGPDLVVPHSHHLLGRVAARVEAFYDTAYIPPS